MTHRPIIDAGPSLNFLSTNSERLLFDTLGPLSAPESVRDEVLRKSRRDRRFRAAEQVWRKLPDRLLQILSDDQTPELAAVVSRISGLPMEERLRDGADLGETMVIAHAVVAAEQGHDVIVLIDDGPGSRIATREIRRLERLRGNRPDVGLVRLASTLTVLAKAAGGPYLPDRVAMRDTYERLHGLDDGLPPIAGTGLLTQQVWGPAAKR